MSVVIRVHIVYFYSSSSIKRNNFYRKWPQIASQFALETTGKGFGDRKRRASGVNKRLWFKITLGNRKSNRNLFGIQKSSGQDISSKSYKFGEPLEG